MRLYNPLELKCDCCGLDYADKQLYDRLDVFSDNYGFWFTITSGYRCVQNNILAGGAKNSAHIKGLAADIHCPDSRTLYYMLAAIFQDTNKNKEPVFNRIGIYPTWIHVDCDESKDREVIWRNL